MTRRTRTALTGGVLIVALLVMGAGFPTKTRPSPSVPPKHWATSVCGALHSWVDGAKQGATDLQSSIQGKASRTKMVRDAIAAYLGDTARSTTVVLHKLKRAGAPATPKGTEAVGALRKGFEQARTALSRLRRQAEHISTRHRAAALADLRTLKNRVDTEFRSLDGAFNGLDRLDPGHQLSTAFKSSRACQSGSG